MTSFVFDVFLVFIISQIIPPFTGYEIVQLVAFVFAVFWLTMNFYNLFPVFQLILERIYRYIFGGKAEEDLLVEVKQLSEKERLPIIDVLVPAYKEGYIIENAIESLSKTEYPKKYLNINILIEPSDLETKEALVHLKEKYDFTVFEVPSDYPLQSNKPRALNYGFEKTNGDIVGIIDAEDIVDVNIFSHVVSGLILEDRDFVQGRLDMVNEDDGWKNLLFRAEYSYWFNILLKGFFQAGYPVPLGGTTNFFKRSVLEEISDFRIKFYNNNVWPKDSSCWFCKNGLKGWAPWDPKNVTEDFELGLLLWIKKYTIGYMDITTKEESPLDYSNWITQRTRWEKGKVYSLFQWLRYPPKGIYIKFHLYMQSFLPHYGPINLMGVVILMLYYNFMSFGVAGIIIILLLINVVFTIGYCLVHGVAYWNQTKNVGISKIFRSLIVIFSLPLYWILFWGADIRALYQIYRGVLKWEKTDHHARNRLNKK